MSQNLLSNVFKPTYVYDPTGKTYSTRLELLNLDVVSANTVSALRGSIGDNGGNVYVGTNAGNTLSNSLGNTNVIALGVGAGQGSSNSSYAIFIGNGAGSGALNSLNTISIGTNSLGYGTGNIYLGTGTGSMSGTSNTFLGQNIAPSGTITNTLLIGNGSTTTITGNVYQSGILIAGITNATPVYLTGTDGYSYLYSCNAVGINTTTPTYTLDVNGYGRIGTNQNGGLGINTNPVDYTLNVNGDMQVTDGYGVFRFTHDAGCNSVTTLDVTGTYTGAVATMAATGGFFSSTGTTAGSTTTIPLKKGMFMISAISNTTAQGYVGVAASESAQTLVSSNAGSLITSNAGNVTIAANTTWTVTYFPSP
jgi:hypothetical protein